uniref:PH domain-containing protein n=1 Tax=Prasinoderma singulare TaxID=676789 RepID=A0A7S3BNB3_9VIRI|mmetsp:Transcript_20984/g.65015  ORF Transcript_20984/g.65015 Transcript_20984/m.65015 type:complete len:148 (+) Transcript_20984:255-698(+)
MASKLRELLGAGGGGGAGGDRPDPYGGVEWWQGPFERSGWLQKQGELLPNWRRRFFVIKQGKIFWFKKPEQGQAERPRGCIDVRRCLSIKGAEDAINKAHAFELSTAESTMYFVADSDKEKEEWINAVGKAIVRSSHALADAEFTDY